MKYALADVRSNADRCRQARDDLVALRLYSVVLRHAPEDFGARLALADTLLQMERRAEAIAVYQATAQLCIDGGQPLVAVVATRAVEAAAAGSESLEEELELGRRSDELVRRLAETHGRGSERLAEVGARLTAQLAGIEVSDRELQGESLAEEVIAEATRVGSDLAPVGELPWRYPPVPILGRLRPPTMIDALAAMVVHRLPAGHLLIRQGEQGTACYLVASGRLRVLREDDAGEQRQVASVGPNAVVGEMALITGSPRQATVEVVEPADVLELGPDALAAIGDELDELAPALDRVARSRWMRNLLEQSPLFRIFTPAQHKDLLKRCSAHEVPAGTVLFEQGEAAKGLYMLLRGEIELRREISPAEPPTRVPLQAGAVAGVESVLDGRPAETSAVTVAPATVLFLSRRIVAKLLEGVPEFADAVRLVAAHRRRITMIPQ